MNWEVLFVAETQERAWAAYELFCRLIGDGGLKMVAVRPVGAKP